MASRASFAPGVVAGTTSGRRSARCRCSGSWIDLLARLPSLPTRSTSDVLSVRTQLQLRDSAGFPPDFPTPSAPSVGNAVLVSKALANASFASEKHPSRYGWGPHDLAHSSAAIGGAQRPQPLWAGRRRGFRCSAAARAARPGAPPDVRLHPRSRAGRAGDSAESWGTRRVGSSGCSRRRSCGRRCGASAVYGTQRRRAASPTSSFCCSEDALSAAGGGRWFRGRLPGLGHVAAPGLWALATYRGGFARRRLAVWWRPEGRCDHRFRPVFELRPAVCRDVFIPGRRPARQADPRLVW